MNGPKIVFKKEKKVSSLHCAICCSREKSYSENISDVEKDKKWQKVIEIQSY